MGFRKSLWELQVNSCIPQGSILYPILFLLYIDVFPYDAVANFAIYASDITLIPKSGQASEFWQQLDFASGFESDLQETVDLNSK